MPRIDLFEYFNTTKEGDTIVIESPESAFKSILDDRG